MSDPRDDGHPHPRGFLLILFLVITLAAALDLALDRPATLWSVHILAELTVVSVGLAAAAYLSWGWVRALRDVRELQEAAEARREERDAWKQRASQSLRGLSEAMDAQFDAWDLTPAERETALMLLKGLSHKRIGKLTDRSERTARQHAVSVYRKSGLAGRSELSAFFLEGLLLPDGSPPGTTAE